MDLHIYIDLHLLQRAHLHGFEYPHSLELPHGFDTSMWTWSFHMDLKLPIVLDVSSLYGTSTRTCDFYTDLEISNGLGTPLALFTGTGHRRASNHGLESHGWYTHLGLVLTHELSHWSSAGFPTWTCALLQNLSLSFSRFRSFFRLKHCPFTPES